ncbi:MAG: cytochrome P450 [Acidobacteriota bacterium]|nr:cytochrome P450 [Acidobacteriota bacterium]
MSTAGLPRGFSLPPIAQTVWWLTRPLSFLATARRRYGENFTVRFLGFERPMVMLSDPDAIRALYTERANGLPPGRSVALLPIVGPDSLLLLEGEEHMARRRIMLPPFHGERMRSYETVIREVTESEIDRWPSGQGFALHPHMQALTLEVILHAVFGVSDPERGDLLRARLRRLLNDSASARLQVRVLLTNRFSRGDPLRRVLQLTSEIDKLLFTEIAERRADAQLEAREDILSLLILARMEDGTGMSDRELRDQLITLLLAGHETTATALAWTFDLLLHHPAELDRLVAETREGEGDEYVRAVIAESLRLRPVVPLAGRRLAVDLQAGGMTLPAGSDVTPAIWLTHTRPDLYPEPFEFRPERFLDGAPSTYGWIPFGGGVRRCLGAAFAEQEMRVVLRTVLGRCTLEPVSSRPERAARRNVTLAPRRGTRVRLVAREPRSPAASEPVAA